MKKTTPFKAPSDFENELTEFSNKYKVLLADHSKRISDYFEMSCYNFVIRYYEKKGYKLDVQNLQGGKFKFKCSPTGLLKNFSYFKATKRVIKMLMKLFISTITLQRNLRLTRRFLRLQTLWYQTPIPQRKRRTTILPRKHYHIFPKRTL